MSAQPLPNAALAFDLPPAPGSILAGAYRVESRLGNGGMGVVLRATEVAADRQVAIKVMTSAAAADSEQVARFRREAKAASSLTSQHVVRVLDFGELESGLPYLVMEHLEGRSLVELSKERGPLPVGEAVDFILQAIHGVAEAHALGIVHRDLKPANLFVTGEASAPMVKVLDFGASKLTAESTVDPSDPGGVTVASSLIGSPRYMAPEQIRSALEVDARADIYALGATLHELLTGRPIFSADSLARIFAQVLWDAPEALSATRDDVPGALAEIVSRCLAKAPADRFATVEALAAALAPFGSSRAKAPAPAPRPRPAISAARKAVVLRSTVRMPRVRTASEAPKRTMKIAAFALAARLAPGVVAIPSPAADAIARGARTARMVRFDRPVRSAGRAAAVHVPKRRPRVMIAAASLALLVLAFVATVGVARHRGAPSRAPATSAAAR